MRSFIHMAVFAATCCMGAPIAAHAADQIGTPGNDFFIFQGAVQSIDETIALPSGKTVNVMGSYNVLDPISILDGRDGYDTLLSTNLNEFLSDSRAPIFNIEDFRMGDGHDFVDLRNQGIDLTIFGGIQNDILISGSGNDLVEAGNGNDVIDSGAGADEVFADRLAHSSIGNFNGNDHIDTGAGNDVAHVGRGLDTIKTGPGDDIIRFYLDTDNLIDIVVDFSTRDILDLSAITSFNGSSGDSIFDFLSLNQLGADTLISVNETGLGGIGNFVAAALLKDVVAGDLVGYSETLGASTVLDNDVIVLNAFGLGSGSGAPVPLPASLPLLLAGLAMIGWVGYRRKTADAGSLPS